MLFESLGECSPGHADVLRHFFQCPRRLGIIVQLRYRTHCPRRALIAGCHSVLPRSVPSMFLYAKHLHLVGQRRGLHLQKLCGAFRPHIFQFACCSAAIRLDFSSCLNSAIVRNSALSPGSLSGTDLWSVPVSCAVSWSRNRWPVEDIMARSRTFLSSRMLPGHFCCLSNDI